MKRIVALLLILILSLFITGCNSSSITEYEVKYEITGTDNIDLIYYDAAENEITKENIDLPWSYTFIGKKGNTARIEYGRNTYSDTIISRIMVNGQERESLIDNNQWIVVIWDEI